MDIPKRKKPLVIKGHIAYLLLGLLLFWGPVLYISKEGEGNIFEFALCSPLWGGGIVLAGLAVYSLVSKQSDLNKYTRSAASSTGTILKRYTIQRPSFFEAPDDIHMVVIQFNATLGPSESKQYRLEMQIPGYLYEQLQLDSEILVKYAAEDPRIACLEGE